MSSAFPRPSAEHGSATIVSQCLPDRVRRILLGLLELAADEVERGLNATLADFEQQLFKLAEQSRNAAEQAAYFETQRMVRRNRADLLPRYLIALEDALATIRSAPAAAPAQGQPRPPSVGELALVDTREIDESTVLREIGARAENRAALQVYLLGQRFGVLAARPAYDAETLPIGPHRLCRMLHATSDCLGIDVDARLLLLRVFERQAMPAYPAFVESANAWLCEQGVLPTLRFVPVRARPAARDRRAPRDADAAPGARVAEAPPAWTTVPGASASFDVLRQLLAGRRALIGKFAQDPARQLAAAVDLPPPAAPPAGPVSPIPAQTLQAALARLQREAPPPGGSGTAIPRIKQDVLAQLRAAAGDAAAPVLEDEDNDTIDLIGLLFEHLMKDVRPNSPAAGLLARLQVPLVRVALRDKSFFSRPAHPAREMLNNIAESGMWLAEDDADGSLGQRLESVVDRAVAEYDDDDGLFQTLSDDLSGHLQTLARKAEVAERRHVDAARGKEKMALSRLRAAETLEQVLEGRRLPRFVRSLLRQAWTDVMALAALRHGEGSEEWRQRIGIAERIADAADAAGGGRGLAGPDAEALRARIEDALAQVGYHDAEAQAIALRLTDADGASGDDGASRTELAMKLKARARLGEDREAANQADLGAPLDARERACLEQLRALPFGTWFEFAINQQGDRVRRRLSWFSTVTGNTLFVNHRGQRVGEYGMDWLARAMANGQVRPVTAEDGSLLDRAWGAVVSALRSFAARVPVGAGA
ncbi:DUF1631 domain-containing protein [Coralloluteibacterium thermophilus]|uniref:DUF1631 domain-containing protein n=1 Tax=Coralloluteibacterium thermophilum TaxID=2707049 RepID=A0ABV9NI15_9GAMM